MRIIMPVVCLALLSVTYGAYSYLKQDFSYHVSYIGQDIPLFSGLSKFWLKSCPEIPANTVEPNSIFGFVIAGRETLGSHFDYVINTLVDCGYDIEERDSLGLTSLHAAVLYADIISVKKLVSLGADKNALLSGEAAQKYGALNALEFAKRAKDVNVELVKHLEGLP